MSQCQTARQTVQTKSVESDNAKEMVVRVTDGKSLDSTIWLKSKGDERLQRTGEAKAASEARHALACSADKGHGVILLFFCRPFECEEEKGRKEREERR